MSPQSYEHVALTSTARKEDPRNAGGTTTIGTKGRENTGADEGLFGGERSDHHCACSPITTMASARFNH